MTRYRWGLLAAGLLIAALAAALLVTGGRDAGRRERPRLLILTSLPLLFPEGFGLEAKSVPLVDALRERYELVAIDTTAPEALAKGTLLIMAQPRAQAPENLVALDQWVRAGGKLLLFADPKLDWPSELPLGDLNRPPPMFADTGLLGHWGLRLDAPLEPGPSTSISGGRSLALSSPGTLVKTWGSCALSEGGLMARCRLGKGEALVVADADLLNFDELGNADDDAVRSLLEKLMP